MMAHSLTSAAIPIPTCRSKLTISSSSSHESSLKSLMSFHGVCACLKVPHEATQYSNVVYRRSVALGLVGVVVGVNLGEKSAIAARRPPPPPPEEKKDPSITGLAAKVLASKKRKEALKQEVARLREKGKAIVPEPSE